MSKKLKPQNSNLNWLAAFLKPICAQKIHLTSHNRLLLHCLKWRLEARSGLLEKHLVFVHKAMDSDSKRTADIFFILSYFSKFCDIKSVWVSQNLAIERDVVGSRRLVLASPYQVPWACLIQIRNRNSPCRYMSNFEKKLQCNQPVVQLIDLNYEIY